MNPDRRARRAAAIARAETAQAALAAHSVEDDEFERLNEAVGRAWTHPDIPWWRHPLGPHRVIVPIFTLAAAAAGVVLGYHLGTAAPAADIISAAVGLGLAGLGAVTSARQLRLYRH